MSRDPDGQRLKQEKKIAAQKIQSLVRGHQQKKEIAAQKIQSLVRGHQVRLKQMKEKLDEEIVQLYPEIKVWPRNNKPDPFVSAICEAHKGEAHKGEESVQSKITSALQTVEDYLRIKKDTKGLDEKELEKEKNKLFKDLLLKRGQEVTIEKKKSGATFIKEISELEPIISAWPTDPDPKKFVLAIREAHKGEENVQSKITNALRAAEDFIKASENEKDTEEALFFRELSDVHRKNSSVDPEEGYRIGAPSISRVKKPKLQEHFEREAKQKAKQEYEQQKRYLELVVGRIDNLIDNLEEKIEKIIVPDTSSSLTLIEKIEKFMQLDPLYLQLQRLERAIQPLENGPLDAVFHKHSYESAVKRISGVKQKIKVFFEIHEPEVQAAQAAAQAVKVAEAAEAAAEASQKAAAAEAAQKAEAEAEAAQAAQAAAQAAAAAAQAAQAAAEAAAFEAALLSSGFSFVSPELEQKLAEAAQKAEAAAAEAAAQAAQAAAEAEAAQALKAAAEVKAREPLMKLLDPDRHQLRELEKTVRIAEASRAAAAEAAQTAAKEAAETAAAKKAAETAAKEAAALEKKIVKMEEEAKEKAQQYVNKYIQETPEVAEAIQAAKDAAQAAQTAEAAAQKAEAAAQAARRFQAVKVARSTQESRAAQAAAKKAEAAAQKAEAAAQAARSVESKSVLALLQARNAKRENRKQAQAVKGMQSLRTVFQSGTLEVQKQIQARAVDKANKEAAAASEAAKAPAEAAAAAASEAAKASAEAAAAAAEAAAAKKAAAAAKKETEAATTQEQKAKESFTQKAFLAFTAIVKAKEAYQENQALINDNHAALEKALPPKRKQDLNKEVALKKQEAAQAERALEAFRESSVLTDKDLTYTALLKKAEEIIKEHNDSDLVGQAKTWHQLLQKIGGVTGQDKKQLIADALHQFETFKQAYKKIKGKEIKDMKNDLKTFKSLLTEATKATQAQAKAQIAEAAAEAELSSKQTAAKSAAAKADKATVAADLAKKKHEMKKATLEYKVRVIGEFAKQLSDFSEKERQPIVSILENCFEKINKAARAEEDALAFISDAQSGQSELDAALIWAELDAALIWADKAPESFIPMVEAVKILQAYRSSENPEREQGLEGGGVPLKTKQIVQTFLTTLKHAYSKERKQSMLFKKISEGPVFVMDIFNFLYEKNKSHHSFDLTKLLQDVLSVQEVLEIIKPEVDELNKPQGNLGSDEERKRRYALAIKEKIRISRGGILTLTQKLQAHDDSGTLIDIANQLKKLEKKGLEHFEEIIGCPDQGQLIQALLSLKKNSYYDTLKDQAKAAAAAALAEAVTAAAAEAAAAAAAAEADDCAVGAGILEKLKETDKGKKAFTKQPSPKDQPDKHQGAAAKKQGAQAWNQLIEKGKAFEKDKTATHAGALLGAFHVYKKARGTSRGPVGRFKSNSRSNVLNGVVFNNMQSPSGRAAYQSEYPQKGPSELFKKRRPKSIKEMGAGKEGQKHFGA